MAKANFSLNYDPWGRLVLVNAEGERHVDVEPIRAFPITQPDRGVSICDDKGHELVWIDDLAQLPPALRKTIEEELRHREFLPVIQRILRVSTMAEPSEWEVETDRGPTRFILNSEEDVRRIAPFRTLISDSHGLRYLVPDARQLDTASRHVLDRYL